MRSERARDALVAALLSATSVAGFAANARDEPSAVFPPLSDAGFFAEAHEPAILAHFASQYPPDQTLPEA